MKSHIEINGRRVGPGCPAYVVAEMSANHNRDFNQAVQILEAARQAGADAIKLQTYTPETLTIDCDNSYFVVGKGSPWEGRTLHELYGEAYTPWEWQPKLKEIATQLGLDCFSSPFDATAVDFLERMDVPVYKIASFELVDFPLIKRVAATGKPLILSTGMATLLEIEEALQIIRDAGGDEVVLLKCTSAYPAAPEDMNLRAISQFSEKFGVPVGLSDHTMGITAPVAAVALGACMIEKHFTLSREVSGPDSAFSLEPQEFKAMVDAVRAAEAALGSIEFGISESEATSRPFRRSLFVVRDVGAGEVFTAENVRSIRPGYGLHTKHLEEIIGRKATRDIRRGTPLSWDLVE